MLKETADECLCRQLAVSRLPRRGVFIAEGHLAVLQPHDAAVADRDPEDIGRQVFQGAQAIPNGLAVYDPLLLPDLLRDLIEKIALPQAIPKLGPVDVGEGLHRQQEFPPRRPPTFRRETARRDQIMDVWVVAEIPAPGV